MRRHSTFWKLAAVALVIALWTWGGARDPVSGLTARHPFKPFPDLTVKGQPIHDLLSSGGHAALFGDDPENHGDEGEHGKNNEGTHGIDNIFVNDPCLDPPPTLAPPLNRRRTVQSETEIAVLNSQGSPGKKMVVGYNDSFGFFDNREGLSGFAYSTDGGEHWIDGGGLPPKVPAVATFVPNLPPLTGGRFVFPAGADRYFGDPVVVVHHKTETFYFASIYQDTDGFSTLSVNRSRFQEAPPQGNESRSNTRCLDEPALHGIADPPLDQEERPIWEAPVVTVPLAFLGDTTNPDTADFLDKEWLYVDQKTGTLYMTYTRFAGTGETPIELVRCIGCAFKTGPLTTADWTPPSVIVPNEAFDFNQGTQPITTPSGRVIVTWFAREFATTTPFPEIAQRIEVAVSDDDGVTFSPEIKVADVNPQREPLGYNRNRRGILNAAFIAVDKGEDDGVDQPDEVSRPGFGNVYITYFNGVTAFPTPTTTSPFLRAGQIHLSTSTNGGSSWGPKVLVSDDGTQTSHVFPSVQVDKHGDVFVAWNDRRLDPANNTLTDTWAARSRDQGQTFGLNARQTDVSSSWFVRADARPNFGDYNSSELMSNHFVTTWADGRFRPPGGANATPDTMFARVKHLDRGRSTSEP